jgi:phage/plasmid-associated DNA primase
MSYDYELERARMDKNEKFRMEVYGRSYEPLAGWDSPEQHAEYLRRLDGDVEPEPQGAVEAATPTRSSAAEPASTGSSKTLARYDDSALGDAFVAAHPELIWNASKKTWMRYDGTRGIWAIFDDEEAGKILDRFLKRLQIEGEASTDKNVQLGAKRCGDQRTQDAVTKKIKLKHHIQQSELDQDPWRRVFANGVFDPRQPGVIAPFDPELYSTRCSPVDYDPTATHPRLMEALAPLPADALDWFQLMAGQSILGFQPAAEFIILMYGPRASNGKSTIFDLMEKTLGEYEDGHPTKTGYFGRPAEETLLSGESYDLIAYEGLSQAGIEEIPAKRLESSPLKRLVGTAGFKGRQIYEKTRMVHNRATIWITCNTLPSFDSSDEGVKRRLKVLPFDKKYVNTAAELAQYAEGMAYLKDPSIKGMATSDPALLRAFLAWRMEGAIRWCATPESKRAELEATLPESVKSATDRHQNREDTVQAWLDDCIVFEPMESEAGMPLNPTSFVLWSDLFLSYTAHLKANGHAYGVKLNTFQERFDLNRQVQKHGVEKIKGRVGTLTHSVYRNADGEYEKATATPRHVRGIRFRTAMDDQDIPAAPDTSDDDKRRMALLDLIKQAERLGFSASELAAATATHEATVEDTDDLTDDFAIFGD